MNEKQITSVEAYRSRLSEPKFVTTPSGAVFKVRRLPAMDFIKEGLSDIPNDFFKFIAELSAGIKMDYSTPEMQKNYEIFEKFLKIIVEKGIIDPPVILKYEEAKRDTHLVYAELTEADQKFLADAITGKISV